MSLLISILAAIFAIFIVVLIHEMGHFMVARWNGVKVLKFSIGFGKALWSYRSKKSGAEYVIGMLPLGGYVRMLGEEDDVVDSSELEHAYSRKSVWARIAIVLAGPVINFLLALLIFWAIFLSGVTHVRPVIGKVTAGSIAAQGGLHPGDEVKRVNGMVTYSWQRVVMALISRIGDKGDLKMTVLPRGSDVVQVKRLPLKNWQFDSRKPDLLGSLGFSPYIPPIPPVVAKVLPNSPAAKAGIKPGDRVVSIDGKRVNDWIPLIKQIAKKPGATITLAVIRDGKSEQLKLRVGRHKVRGKIQGYLGVYSVPPNWPKGMIQTIQFNVFSAWVSAVTQVWTVIKFNSIAFYKIVVGKISLRALGGPITIFKTAGQASQGGWLVYFGFMAFISATLGFINILPIPGLDGGHFLFHIIEVIIRRPLSDRTQSWAIRIGLFALISIMVLATLNDLWRLL